MVTTPPKPEPIGGILSAIVLCSPKMCLANSSVPSTIWAINFPTTATASSVLSLFCCCALSHLLDVPCTQLSTVRRSPLIFQSGSVSPSFYHPVFRRASFSVPPHLLPSFFLRVLLHVRHQQFHMFRHGFVLTFPFSLFFSHLSSSHTVLPPPSFSPILSPPYPKRRLCCDDPTSVSILSSWWDPSSCQVHFYVSTKTWVSKKIRHAVLQQPEHLYPQPKPTWWPSTSYLQQFPSGTVFPTSSHRPTVIQCSCSFPLQRNTLLIITCVFDVLSDGGVVDSCRSKKKKKVALPCWPVCVRGASHSSS